MLKYKNRLTPNVNTLHQLITFYKKKKTSPLTSVNRLSVFWIMQSLNKNQPSFRLVFNNIFSLTQGSWNLTQFTTSLNNPSPQKYFSTLLKTTLFQKKKILVQTQELANPLTNYPNLMSTSLPLIGKPFNPQNAYFFTSKNYEESDSSLRPFFSKMIWKRYVLKTLKHRFTLNTTRNLSNQTKFQSLLTKDFGGPVPTNNNLFLKPYLFTNNSEKKLSATRFTLTILKSPFNLFKSTTKKFVKRRYTWSNRNFKKYSKQSRTVILLSSFNLISNLQAKKVKNINTEIPYLADKLIKPSFFNKFSYKAGLFTSKSLLSETVKLLRPTKKVVKTVKSLTRSSHTPFNVAPLYIKSTFRSYLRTGKTFLRLSNCTLNHFTYRTTKRLLGKRTKLLAKRRTKLFRLKRARRAKTLKKLIKAPLNLLNSQPLKTFLVRPRRWGRKFLRRLALRKNLNLTTFSLRILKITSPINIYFKLNHSILHKKFLWRKFLKWRKVKKLKKTSIRQKLLFNNFFLKYLSTNFATPKALSKLKFRLTLIKNLPYSFRQITLFPNLLTLTPLNHQPLTYFNSTLVPQLFTDNISLVSNYGISFILPLYGFLFITSDKLIASQQITDQLSLKKTVHSFFYLSDLKSFVAGKHSSIVNNYNSFFTPSDGNFLTKSNHLDSPIFSSMTSFLTTNFTCLIDHASDNDVLQRKENDPRIPRFKFKPGYSRIWRRARTGIKEYFQIKFQYQHRLTKYLPQFYKLSRISLIKSTELKLENLLLFTHLLPDLVTCQEFFNSNLVFLNGRTVFCGKVYTVRNDFIQILISIKYYILFKWFMNWEVLKKTRLNRLLYLSRLTTKRTFRKTLPDWVLRKISYPYDVPKYIEVDYLTLSAFVLYEPYLSNDFTHMFQKFSRSPIYNVYNWKYLT